MCNSSRIIFQMEKPLSSTTLTSAGGVVTCMHITPKYIIVALDNGQLHVFDHKGDNEIVVKPGEQALWCVDVWEDEWIVVGGVQGFVSVWNLGQRELKEKVKLPGHNKESVINTVRCVKVLSAKRLVSGSRDSTMKIWNIETGDCEAVLEGHTKTIRSLAIHEGLLVSSSYDNTARIWNLETKECLQVFEGHTSQVYSVVFDGKRIVTGSLDSSARVWDPSSGNCLATLTHGSLVGQLQLLPSKLVTGDSTGTIRVWSLDDFSECHSIAAHGNSVTSLACDTKRIVSGGSDGKVKVWDLETGAMLKDLVKLDAVWQVGLLKDGFTAVFSRDEEVVLQTWGVGA